MLFQHRISVTLALANLLGLWVLISGLLGGCTALAPIEPTPVSTIQPAGTPTVTTPAPIPLSISPSASPTDSFYTEYKKEHFTIYYTAEISPTQVVTVANYLEAAWRDIPAFLGIEPPSRPIRMYAGLRTSANWGTPSGVIVLHPDTLKGGGYSAISHEFTHVLTKYSGPQWMEEGLAVCMAEKFPLAEKRSGKISADSWSVGLLKANKWVTLWEWPIGIPEVTDPTQSFNLFRAYRESGSFVKYLIETYGTSAFWKMHDDINGWFVAEKAYGKSVDALLEEWRQHLAASTIPPEECPDCISAYLERVDIDMGAYRQKDKLSSEIREQISKELQAVDEALIDRLDAQAMRQHVEAARHLLEANVNK
ncbi:MAG: hypothetical protein AB1566_04510 [Chloroflexota bacterium]